MLPAQRAIQKPVSLLLPGSLAVFRILLDYTEI